MSYMPKAYVDSAGGGGGAVYGSGEIDFGAFPGSSYAELAVSAPGIAAGAVVAAWIMAEDTADHLAAEHAVEGFRVVAGSVVAGVGFTIRAALSSDLNEPLVPQHIFRALAVTPKPDDHGTLGHYGLSVQTGTLAAALAAGAVIFSARWGDATRLCVVRRVRARFLPLTPFTAATLTDHTSLDAYVGRSFSGSHTGGTALTLTGNSFKRRASMSSTLFTDLRIATTAALGGGTITVDAHPFAQSLRKGNRVNPAAATEETIQPTDDPLDWSANPHRGDHPIVLAQNEGIVIRNRTVWPAAGTGIVVVQFDWAEVTAY